MYDKIEIKAVIVELNSDYKKTILLASMGRSGSTWLGDIINYDNKYRDIFEPFFPEKVKEAEAFVYPQYIPPDNKEKHFLDPAKIILTGGFRNTWTDANNKKLFVTARMIKDIRVNFFLKWIHRNFPEIPIILLLRHPCAVVLSWIKAGFGDGTRPQKRILSQSALLQDVLSPFAENYANAKDAFERLIFLWCIHYYVPFRQFKSHELCVVFYENMYLKPEDELKKIFGFLGRPYRQQVIDKLSKPSRTTIAGSEVKTGGDVINGWKKEVTSAQIEKAYEIMSLFGLEKIYNSNSIPDENYAYKLMR